MVEKRSLLVEIIGPAGSGKTTLLKTLTQRGEKVQSSIHPSKIRQVPFFISNTFSLLPIYVRHYRHSRWFNWRETRSMSYLKAGLRIVERQASNNSKVIIMDHGPIYRLAFLRALGPEITTSQSYMNWWINVLNKWAATLDVLIWLDAPNSILVNRIRKRNTNHTVKDKHKEEAYKFLTRYRTFLAKIISDYMSDRQVLLLKFNTNQLTVNQIADRVLAKFDSASSARLKRSSNNPERLITQSTQRL